MFRRTTVWFNLLFLALIYFRTKALPLFDSNFFRKSLVMNAHATSSGIIDLKKDSNSPISFYVEADFSSSKASSQSDSNSLAITDTVQMMVSIPNRETLVVSNCLGFNSYDCSRYNCQNYSWTTTLDYPSFTANVTFSKGYIYLDYTYWNLNSDYMYIAQSCNTDDTYPTIGSGRYGVLGLGTATATNHFTSSPIFSIFLNSNLTGGKLLFKKDTDSCAQFSTPLFTFSANSTWQFPAKRAYLETPNTVVALDNLIVAFDINSDAIGLPFKLYSAFLTSFGQIPNVWCDSENYKAYCYTTLNLEGLPDLTLSINNNKITIPSKIYATLTKTSDTYNYFSFNFRVASPEFSGHSYASPSFDNSLILDANFMSYYYTVFDASKGSNMIYIYPSINARPVPEPQPDDSLIKWLAIGIAGTVILTGICVYAKKKRDAAHKNKTADTPINNTTTDGLNDTPPQTPLIYNQQGAYNAYNNPPQAQPHGVYQPYPPQQSQGGMEYAKGCAPSPAVGTQ